METSVPLPKRGRSPQKTIGPCLLWPNGWMDQDGTWHGGRPQPRRLRVRWGRSPRKVGGAPSPIFSPCKLWRNGWKYQDGTWHAGGPWSAQHCARWGPSSPPKRGGGRAAPIFGLFYCGQMAGCIKMPLCMEVGLSPGDFVLDGHPAPSQKGRGSPSFRPVYIVAKRLDGSRWHLA